MRGTCVRVFVFLRVILYTYAVDLTCYNEWMIFCVSRKAFPLLWWEPTRSIRWMETRCWAVRQSGESLKVRHHFNISLILCLAKQMSRCDNSFNKYCSCCSTTWNYSTSFTQRFHFLTLENISGCIGLLLELLSVVRHPVPPQQQEWKL